MALAFSVLALGASFMQSRAQVQESQAITQAEQFNIGVAKQEQQIEEASRELDKTREKKQLTQILSTQQAMVAKSGVTSEGSPLLVMRDTAAQGELDILVGDINSSINQSRLQSEVEQRGVSITQERAAGKIRAGKTLLSGITQFGSSFF